MLARSRRRIRESCVLGLGAVVVNRCGNSVNVSKHPNYSRVSLHCRYWSRWICLQISSFVVRINLVESHRWPFLVIPAQENLYTGITPISTKCRRWPFDPRFSDSLLNSLIKRTILHCNCIVIVKFIALDEAISYSILNSYIIRFTNCFTFHYFRIDHTYSHTRFSMFPHPFQQLS